MKFWSDKRLAPHGKLNKQISLLYPFWNDFSEAERLHKWGLRYSLFQMVDDPADADFLALPALYTYYRSKRLLHMVKSFVQIAEELEKPVVVFDFNDNVFEIPSPNVWLFHTALDKRYRKTNQFAVPAIVDDMAKYYHDNQIPYREKPAKPVVGFCGQAAVTLETTVKYTVKNLYFNLRHLLFSKSCADLH